MNNTPNPNRSFFSIAAWYAVVASLVAAAISGVGWLILFLTKVHYHQWIMHLARQHLFV